MTVEGISHITLIVRDLDRTGRLLSTVLGAAQVYDSGEAAFSLSRERFFLLGGTWIALMEGTPNLAHTYDHIAFKIPESELDEYRHRIEHAGLKIRQARPRIQGEGESLYFYDFDGHLFELHTGTLEDRLRAYGRPGAEPAPLTPTETPPAAL